MSVACPRDAGSAAASPDQNSLTYSLCRLALHPARDNPVYHAGHDNVLYHAQNTAVGKRVCPRHRARRANPSPTTSASAAPPFTGRLRPHSRLDIKCFVSRRREQYQDYTIEATSFPLRDDAGYTVHYNLIKDERSHVDDTYCQSGAVFASDEDALDAGINMARQTIDSGFRPNKTVTNKSVGEPRYDRLIGPPDLDPRYGNNFIDANALHLTGGPEDAALDEILRLLGEDDTFTLLLPHSVKAEIEHPNTPADVKRRAAHMIYSMPVQMTAPELATHEKMRALIQGNAKTGQHDKDAFHLVESAKYGRQFITNDGRLLKKAEEIWAMLNLKVLKPSEFLAAYLDHAKRPSWTYDHHSALPVAAFT